MGLKRVSPPTLQAFGGAMQGHFGNIHTTLTTLVNDVVGVQYFGGNAFKFKTQAGQMTAEFANGFARDMGKVAGDVSATTTRISQSLGGPAIQIAVDARAITPPAAQPDTGDTEVETAALDALVGTVNGHFEAIRTEIDTNLRDLDATDWIGEAKTNCMGQVGAWSTSAKNTATDAQNSLTRFITEQINSVVAADV